MANKFIIEIRTQGFKGAKKDLENVNKQTRSTVRNSNKASTATASFRRQMSGLRNNLLLVSFAFGAAVSTMSKFVKDAANLEESINKFRVVFGGATDDALEFADTLSETFRRSKTDILPLMAALQDTFVPLGFSRKEASKLSQALTQLSFDVSSFQNVASPEVANAFTSAIVGNHEAVRRFGIILTEASVKQEAMRMGLVMANQELSNQDKILARVSIIIGSTKDAHGDLLRTQEDFTNITRELNDVLKDLSVQFGEILLPMAKVIVELGLHFTKTSTIKGYALSLKAVGLAFVYIKRQAILAAFATLRFRSALIKTGYGLAIVAIGELASKFMFAGDEAEDLTQDLLDLDKALNVVVESTNSLSSSYRAMISAQTGSLIALKGEISVVSAEIKTLGIELQSIEAVELSEGIRDIGRSMDFLSSEQRAVITGVESISSSMATAILNAQDMEEAFKSALKAMAAELLAQAATFALLNMFTGGTYGTTTSFLKFAFGHTGGLVTPTGIQKFAGGGSVLGGVDTVPAMLQPGEFVLSKNAVQNMGVESAKAINQGQNAGGLTINISGGIIQDDYVRNELIPAINKAKALA